jgi:beta-ribofuranosylaminobenzene 5'-phosphate synthase
VVIKTPSRIHLTLMDLAGYGGRLDGGVGIALEEPNILLEAELVKSSRPEVAKALVSLAQRVESETQ